MYKLDWQLFADKLVKAIGISKTQLAELGLNQMFPKDLLYGLISVEDSEAMAMLREMGVNAKDVIEVASTLIDNEGTDESFAPSDVFFSPKVVSIFKRAEKYMNNNHSNNIRVDHVFLALLMDRTHGASFRNTLGISKAQVEKSFAKMQNRFAVTKDVNKDDDQDNLLEIFTTDLTDKALRGEIDPIIGRTQEMDRAIQILVRRFKNNPVLIGKPGTGKTAIVEGLAIRIAEGTAPMLANKKILSLDLGGLMAGSSMRGELERRLKVIISEIRSKNRQIILFIDEIHSLASMGAGDGGVDAASMLKPVLARGELQCIGATTADEYRKHIEKDAALERRFQPISVDEPSIEQTEEILNGIVSKYENHHGVVVDSQAIKAAAELSARYVTGRFLPDKAIDLLDEACSRVKIDHSENIREDSIVGIEDIAEVVSMWTGIPLTNLSVEESDKYIHMEDELHKELIGQVQAVSAVSETIRRAKAKLSDPDRPLGSFLFCGPTGVGKTELVKVLAGFLFNNRDAVVRIDMSEYGERFSATRLVGSPPGYVGYDNGGQLTEAVRRKPYSIVLFDEIEKAHPDVWNVLLQVLDDGRLTDSHGVTVNFRNVVMVMTSNIASSEIAEFSMGKNDRQLADGYPIMVNKVKNRLKTILRPEFLNRIDEVIVFHPLTREHAIDITCLQVDKLVERLAEQEIKLVVTDNACRELAERGYDAAFGARPLRRTIQKDITNVVAGAIVSNDIVEGDIVTVDFRGRSKNGNKFSISRGYMDGNKFTTVPLGKRGM